MEIKQSFKTSKEFKKHINDIILDIKYTNNVSELYKYQGDDEQTIEFNEMIKNYNVLVKNLKKLSIDLEKVNNQLEPPKNPLWMLILGIILIIYIITIPLGVWLVLKHKKAKSKYDSYENETLDFIRKNENINQILSSLREIYSLPYFQYGWSDNAQQIVDEINSGRSINVVQAKIQVKRENDARKLEEERISAINKEAESREKLAKSINKLSK